MYKAGERISNVKCSVVLQLYLFWSYTSLSVCLTSAIGIHCLCLIRILNDFSAFIAYEPRHEISNKVVCATSKASDQPAHTRSLIRVFASRLNIL